MADDLSLQPVQSDRPDLLPQDLFAGKTVFVTGGGSGINLGIADGFARLGADVAICGRSQDRLDGAAERLRAHGGRVIGHAADVRDPEALGAAVAAAAEETGGIDVMICGAAGNFLAAAEDLSANAFKTILDIDLQGSFNGAKAAYPHLKARRGSLLFISAPMAHFPHAWQAHVGPAKAGVEMLMKSLALEWGPHGIRSNSIIPGLVAETEGLRRITSNPAHRARFEAHVPLRRLGTVDQVADAAVFLASPLASYITGTALWVDGGQGLPGSGFFNGNGATFLGRGDGA